MAKFFTWRARIVFPVLLICATSAYLWETCSPVMSAEKFYRNVRVTGTNPVRISYPKTLVRVRVSEQRDLAQKCDKGGKGDCYFWLVAYEKEFEANDRVFLPSGYLPWAKARIPVTEFQLVAFVGKIPRDKYREILAEIKKPHPKSFRIRQVAKNLDVAKTLEMYYLGTPLKLGIRLRPSISAVAPRKGGLSIVITGKLESIETTD